MGNWTNPGRSTSKRPVTQGKPPNKNPLNPLTKMLKEAKTRILICYLALMAGFIGLSIPLFYKLVLTNVNVRVTRDLWEDIEAFETFVKQEKVITDELDHNTLKRLFQDFLYYRLPEDDTFLITVVAGDFDRSSPEALPDLIRENSLLMQQWQQLQQETQGTQLTNNPEIGSILYLAKPIVRQGKVLGVLVIAHTTAGEIEEAQEAIFVMIEVLLIVLGIAMIFAWIISGKVLSPLRSLLTTARTITDSDLTQRIPVEGTGELAELATTFNDMMDRLENSFISQRAFINDVGHELRTPITVIQGHLELMGDDSQEQQETLALVFDELDRMTRMVNDLQLLAKTERPDFLQLEKIDLSAFIGELFQKITALAHRNWHLGTITPGIMEGDRQRLTQAILNLAENAVQHTTEVDQIELGSEISNQQVRLWVKDTGSGITLPDQKKIFDRFVQGEKRQLAGEGSGLGLSIVKAITEAHHGKVELISRLGMGSTFTLVLPLGSKV